MHFSWELNDTRGGNAMKQTCFSYFSADSINEAMAHVESRLPDTIIERNWLLSEDGYIDWWIIQIEPSAMVRLAFSPEATSLVPGFAPRPTFDNEEANPW